MGLGFIFSNAMLLSETEKTLNSFIDDDSRLYITNPDGETIELKKGCKLVHYMFCGDVKEKE